VPGCCERGSGVGAKLSLRLGAVLQAREVDEDEGLAHATKR
jgi:hypothetical protein